MFLWNAKCEGPPVHERPTEITLVEPKKSDIQGFNALSRQKKPLEHFDDQAKLQTYTSRRSKEQTVARNADINHGTEAENRPKMMLSPPFNPTPPEPEQTHETGEEPSQRPQPKREYQPVQNQAIGSSGTAEFIPGVKQGSITTYSSDQFTFFAFFSRLNDALRYRWVSNIRSIIGRFSQAQLQELALHPRTTLIQVVLTPDGKLKDIYVDTSSGNKEVDEAGVEAFRNAAPFHNPPQGMIESDGLIHIPASFQVYFGPPGFG